MLVNLVGHNSPRWGDAVGSSIGRPCGTSTGMLHRKSGRTG